MLNTLRDWPKKLAPIFLPIRSKKKINRNTFTHIFPRLASATCNSSFDWFTVMSMAFVIGYIFTLVLVLRHSIKKCSIVIGCCGWSYPYENDRILPQIYNYELTKCLLWAVDGIGVAFLVKLVVVLAAALVLFHARAILKQQLIAGTETSRLAPRGSCHVTHQKVVARDTTVRVHFANTCAQCC